MQKQAARNPEQFSHARAVSDATAIAAGRRPALASLPRRAFLGGGMASAAALLAGCGAEAVSVSLDSGPLHLTYLDADKGNPGWPAGPSDFRSRLYAPTQVVRLGTRWFIVDCWHHRIIHSEDLYLPIARWHTLDENIAGPHSIATDGHFFVAEDTGRHGVKVYRQPAPGVFEQAQYLPNIGRRPHRVLFDAARRQFLIVGSEDQTLYILREQAGALVLAAAVHVPELQGQYCRSITLQGDTLWFVGNFHLVRYRMTPQGVVPDTGHITLHARFHGSNDLYFFENGTGGILTSTPRSAVRFRVLDDLALGTATDLAQGTSSGAFSGTPYYVTRMPSGMLLIPEHSDSSSAIRVYPLAAQGFDHSLAQTIVDFGQSAQVSIERKRLLPT
ncbi:MAG: hypothetical protein Q4D19_06080 [Lautropia sp.]|nr:hypothetical protein [Lautropia sp.]